VVCGLWLWRAAQRAGGNVQCAQGSVASGKWQGKGARARDKGKGVVVVVCGVVVAVVVVAGCGCVVVVVHLVAGGACPLPGARGALPAPPSAVAAVGRGFKRAGLPTSPRRKREMRVRLLFVCLALISQAHAKGRARKNRGKDRSWKQRKRDCEMDQCSHLIPDENMNCVNQCTSDNCYEKTYGAEPVSFFISLLVSGANLQCEARGRGN
jgi:hypothetical protein